MSPSKRQGKSISAQYHTLGPICCILYAKHNMQAACLEVGRSKYQEGAREHLQNHAEQRWWDDLSNPRAIALEAASKTLERFEFEVTDEFCDKPAGGTRTTCKDRFRLARMSAGQKTPIYIFIMRTKKYYEVTDAGFVTGPWDWS